MSGSVNKSAMNLCKNEIETQPLVRTNNNNLAEANGNPTSTSSAANIPLSQRDTSIQPAPSGSNIQDRQPVNVNNIDPELRKYTKLFVGGLPFTSGDDALYDYFSKFGPIVEAVVIREKFNNSSKGYGFVTMGDVESAEKAVRNMYPDIDGRRCNVNYAYIGAKKNRHNRFFRRSYDEIHDGALYGYNEEYNYNYGGYPYFDYNVPFWPQMPYHPQYNAYSPYEFRPIYTHPINGNWSFGGPAYPQNPLLSPLIIVRPGTFTQVEVPLTRPAHADVNNANTQAVNSLALSLANATLIQAPVSNAEQSQPQNEEEAESTSNKTLPATADPESNSTEK